MNLFTVAILQTIAAVVWAILAVRTGGNMMSVVLTAVFVLMAVTSWIKIFFGSRK